MKPYAPKHTYKHSPEQANPRNRRVIRRTERKRARLALRPEYEEAPHPLSPLDALT